MYLLTVNEVAEVLQVAPARVYELIRTRALPGVRLGRQVRVSEEALAIWIKNGGKPLRGREPGEATPSEQREWSEPPWP